MTERHDIAVTLPADVNQFDDTAYVLDLPQRGRRTDSDLAGGHHRGRRRS